MNAALMTEPAHWAMGSDLGALAAIFEKAVSLAVMQRRLGPALRSSVLAQGGSGGWQAAWLGIPGETLASELAAQLPAPGQAGPLVADVQLLAEATASAEVKPRTGDAASAARSRSAMLLVCLRTTTSSRLSAMILARTSAISQPFRYCYLGSQSGG